MLLAESYSVILTYRICFACGTKRRCDNNDRVIDALTIIKNGGQRCWVGDLDYIRGIDRELVIESKEDVEEIDSCAHPSDFHISTEIDLAARLSSVRDSCLVA